MFHFQPDREIQESGKKSCEQANPDDGGANYCEDGAQCSSVAIRWMDSAFKFISRSLSHSSAQGQIGMARKMHLNFGPHLQQIWSNVEACLGRSLVFFYCCCHLLRWLATVWRHRHYTHSAAVLIQGLSVSFSFLQPITCNRSFVLSWALFQILLYFFTINECDLLRLILVSDLFSNLNLHVLTFAHLRSRSSFSLKFWVIATGSSSFRHRLSFIVSLIYHSDHCFRHFFYLLFGPIVWHRILTLRFFSRRELLMMVALPYMYTRARTSCFNRSLVLFSFVYSLSFVHFVRPTHFRSVSLCDSGFSSCTQF